MSPDSVARELRRVASLIDASRAPRRDLVTADLRRVLATIGSGSVAGRREQDIAYHSEFKHLIPEIEKRIGLIKEIHDKREKDENDEPEPDSSNIFDFVTTKGVFTIIFDDRFSKIDEFHSSKYND